MPRAPHLLCTLFLLIVATGAARSETPPEAGQPGAAIRLPDAVTPISYRLAIVPDAEHMSFSGEVRIAVEVHRPTQSIVLNAADLTLDQVTLNGETPDVTLDADAQTATLTFAHVLAPGSYDLGIEYRGKIYTSAQGLFALDYATQEGSRRMLATQFEAADARRFVPSWDEPDRKATFQLTVTVPEDQLAISNTPEASTTSLAGGLKQVVFQPTPKMSTYLLFLGMGELERVSRDVDGVEVGVVVRRGAREKAGYALDTASELLGYYNRYFDEPYPLQKLDLVAAPGAASFGAMENWGAIMFFENRVLIDPKLSTESDRETVAVYIAHEMAHQWFGNLVTMVWWNDLWLNESFANWMEAKSLDQLHPDWKIWLWEAGGREDAMRLDASAATHPVIQPAETLDQIEESGDAIVYDKGAAVVRMLEAYVGEDNWQRGVQAYIDRYKYSNATSADLWREIEAAAPGKIVSSITRDFTTQDGLPMVEVEIMGGQGAALGLNEARFVADGGSKGERSWRIPVVAAPVTGGPLVQTMVPGDPLRAPPAEHLVVNANQIGYYRTRYSPAAFAPLADRLAALEPGDQLGLIFNSWAMAEAGYAPAANFMVLVDRLPEDADPRVWEHVLGILTRIDHLYADGPERQAFRRWATRRLEPVMARVGWAPAVLTTDRDEVLRDRLIVTLGAFDDAEIVQEARIRFNQFLSDPDKLAPDIRQAVLAVVGRHADRLFSTASAAWVAMRMTPRRSASIWKHWLRPKIQQLRARL